MPFIVIPSSELEYTFSYWYVQHTRHHIGQSHSKSQDIWQCVKTPKKTKLMKLMNKLMSLNGVDVRWWWWLSSLSVMGLGRNRPGSTRPTLTPGAGSPYRRPLLDGVRAAVAAPRARGPVGLPPAPSYALLSFRPTPRLSVIYITQG